VWSACTQFPSVRTAFSFNNGLTIVDRSMMIQERYLDKDGALHSAVGRSRFIDYNKQSLKSTIWTLRFFNLMLHSRTRRICLSHLHLALKYEFPGESHTRDCMVIRSTREMWVDSSEMLIKIAGADDQCCTL
jgi:hypothetical protein